MSRISELRSRMGISMKEAAQRLDMPYTTYVNYEKGTREPNSETLIKLSKFFGTTIDCLLGSGNPIANEREACKDSERVRFYGGNSKNYKIKKPHQRQLIIRRINWHRL